MKLKLITNIFQGLVKKYDLVLKQKNIYVIVLDDKWGFTDEKGKEIVSPKYSMIGKFCEDLAKVKLNKKWGFIDMTGKEVIPIEYDYALDFKNGVARIRNGYQWFEIDKQGREIE